MLLPKTILGGQIFHVAILQAQHHWFELFNWCLSCQVLCFLLLSQFLLKFRSFVFCHSGANLRAGKRGGCLRRFAYIYMFSLEWIGFPIFIEYLLKPHVANFVFELLALLHKLPLPTGQFLPSHHPVQCEMQPGRKR